MAYGLEINKPNGSIALSTRETVLRFVHIERIAGNFNGTFSVPNFDAIESGGIFTGRGFFYVQYVIRGASTPSNFFPVYGAMILPSLFWNNTTKVMTVSPASIPATWPRRTVPDYDIIFIHFR